MKLGSKEAILAILDRSSMGNHDLEFSDNSIHEIVTTILLGKEPTEVVITEGEYSYKVQGGGGGSLHYRKGNRDWILIANWCVYGLYIVIRYRKPLWLRPMYLSLFTKMNFVSVTFGDHSIEVVGTKGEVLRSRRFQLSPPYALEELLSKKFSFSTEKVSGIRIRLNVSLN